MALKYSNICRVPPVYTTSPRHKYRTLSKNGKTSDLGFSIVKITAVRYFFAALDNMEIIRYVFNGSKSQVGSSRRSTAVSNIEMKIINKTNPLFCFYYINKYKCSVSLTLWLVSDIRCFDTKKIYS